MFENSQWRSRAMEPESASPLDAYLGPLNESERAMLALIKGLSRNYGFCYAGQEFLAERLQVSARHVRRLLTSLHEKGCVAITRQPGRKLRLRVLRDTPEPPPQIVAENARDPGQNPGPKCPDSPDMNVRPGVDKNVRPTAHFKNKDSVEEGLEKFPLFKKRSYFNVFRPRYQGDWLRPEQRICDAFSREGRILYVEHAGKARLIAKAAHNSSGVYLDLLCEESPTAPTERVFIPVRELGSWKFWR